MRNRKGQFVKGNVSYFRGKHPKSEFKKGHKINNGRNPWNKGKNCPQLSGKKCNFWKGGITELADRIRDCFKYRQWRSDIFTRDNFTCQDCGIRNRKGLGKTIILEVHHIKEFNKIIKENNIKTLEDALLCEELWNINNGRTLCKECHNY